MRYLLLFALLIPSATAANWIRVSAPNLEIITDAGDRKAQELLQHFETLRRLFPPSFADSPTPLRVFVFSSARDFDKYRSSQSAAGNYHTDGWQDFIVLPEQGALLSAAAHEYLHMVMYHSSKHLPAWMEEGVAEFYSTISVEGSRVRVGATIAPYLSTLRNQNWLSAEDLAEASTGDGGVFYAESWALVHMLTLSPSWRDGMPKFLKALNEGTDPQAAFAAAFSVSLEDALVALPVYLRSPITDTVPAPPADPSESANPEPIDAPGIALILADLALHSDHPDLARSLFLSAAKDNPDSPAAIAGLGYLALSEDRKDDARRQFEQAIARGYRDAGTFFQLALLKNDNTLLEQALSVDPHFADAHFLLGVRETDQGNFAAAVDHLRQAVAVKPRQFSYWNALAYAQAKQGDRAAAAESARRAALLATTSDQDQMAASLALLATNKPASRQTKPGVVTPSSWKTLKGDTRVEGTLTRVNCDATPVQLTVSQPSGPPLDLNVKNPSTVELVNAEGASTILVCGEQSRPAAVEFVSATKEITRIEFTHVVIMKP